MKAFLLILPILFLITSKVEWLTPMKQDMGTLKSGVPATAVFRFKNTSSEILTIDNVRTTCSCTATDWSEEAVPPNGEGLIRIGYDAMKPGYFNKKITLYFNGQKKAEKLFITGHVE